MKIKILLFLTFMKSTLSLDVKILNDINHSSNEHTDEVWTWRCENGNCRKNGLQEGERPIGHAACKLVCNNGSLWPQPTGKLKVSATLVRLQPHTVKLVSPQGIKSTEAAEVFEGAFEVFRGLVASKEKQGTASGKQLVVHLETQNSDDFSYTQGANESYHLTISTLDDKVTATIKSHNFLGARHGLETLSQLIVEDTSYGQVLTSSEVEISDQPVYTHRGITLDTSRNFISVEKLKKVLDAMSYTKLNSFHWHITDSHSFPFQSKSYPQLTKFGAYSKDKVYTEDEIRELVRYAEIRGIRLVPEVDAPAHVGEGWQWAEGATVCFAAEPWQKFCVEPPCGQLDPTSELVYQVLGGIYSDMAELFKTDHFHMGGDEVNLNCWESTPKIVEEMQKRNISITSDGFHKLWSEFQNRARTLARDKFGSKVRPILWTSTLTEGKHLKYLNSSDYIIQIWTKGNDPTIANLVNNNFPIILSNYDALYFDCGFGAWVGTGNNWCSPYIPWQKVYENVPSKILSDLGISGEKQKLALGAEAALWTEQADDASIENRLWPRGSAMGEALWTGGGKWSEAEHRLLAHRERLIERGIQADTIQPEWCSHHEGACYL